MALVGASTDPQETNDRFRRENELPYPVISDPGGEASRQLGIRAPLGVAARTTFLIGADGRVVRVWTGVKVPGHAREVAEAARQLAGAGGGD